MRTGSDLGKWCFMLVCMFLVVSFAAGRPEAAPAGKGDLIPIPIGVVIEQTGPLSVWGESRAYALQVAAYQIEQAGGFKVGDKSYKFQLTMLDNRSKPEESFTHVRKLLDIDKVKFLIATETTVGTMPIVDILKGRDIIDINSATGLQKLLGQPGLERFFNTYNADFGDNGTALGLLRYAVKQVPAKTIACLDANDSFGQTIIPFYEEAARKVGLTVVASEYYPPGSSDFYPQLSKIKQKNPDLLYVGYTDEAGRAILKQALELGFKNFVTARIGSAIALERKNEIGNWMGLEEKDFMSPEIRNLPGVTKYLEDYGTLFKKEPDYKLLPRIAATYENLYVLAEGMKKAGTVDDAQKIADAIHGIRYEGPIWTMRFDQKGQISLDYYL